MCSTYLQLVRFSVPITKHIGASTVSVFSSCYHQSHHLIHPDLYVSEWLSHRFCDVYSSINVCQENYCNYIGNNVTVINAKLHVSKLHTLFSNNCSSVRCMSTIARPIHSLQQNSLLNKYLDSVMAKYTCYLQERDAMLASVGQSSAADFHDKVEQLNTKCSLIEPVVSLFCLHRQLADDIKQLDEILKAAVCGHVSTDSNGTDADLCKMVKTETSNLQDRLSVIETQIVDLLVPPVFGDQNDIILEVSAGVGGQEAMLFTKELFEMYAKYADYKRWSTDVVDFEVSDLGGVRRAMACISGQNVFMRMKFEGGVHRVQRVPRTEKSGRVHTSTATVAVMARPSEVEVVLNPKDLRIDTCRASGKGGQHVNTTDSAVRIVHLPTGVSAECQTERSQIRNRETAMKVLRTRLYEKEMEVKMKEHSSSRKIQVGSAGRSEKIRTYNIKDDRITDHRLNENVYGVEGILEGGQQLDELIDMLQAESRRERLLEVIQKLE